MENKETAPAPAKKRATRPASAGSKSSKKSPAKKMATPRKRRAKKKTAVKKVAPKTPRKRKSPSPGERPLLSIRALAKLFEYAEATIGEHIKETGGPVEEIPRARRAAKLDPAKWIRFFLERQAGTASQLLGVRTEKIQIGAASKRLEHKLRAGEVIEVETVIEFFTQVMLSIGTTVDGIAGRQVSEEGLGHGLNLIKPPPVQTSTEWAAGKRILLRDEGEPGLQASS